MNKEKQRIAIAEACGWKVKRRDITGYNVWEPDSEFPAQLTNNIENKLPDYLNDLNAMHEAEQILWGMDWSNRYAFNDNLANTLKGRTVNRNEWDAETLLDATAEKRAEAFLKTINKWEEL